MKIILLMVFFSTADRPEVHAGDDYGFGHREVKSMEICVKRRDFLLDQLERAAPKNMKFSAFCVEMELLGFVEGMDDFKKTLGKPT